MQRNVVVGTTTDGENSGYSIGAVAPAVSAVFSIRCRFR
jgi:hypothetical protein